MAVDRRKCFWFGTEERAGWFATPLQGADSSPSAWGVDGTLLNGGGYAFNSFGSHKRYTYEWPQSSSPETAQMMKSYRDGTYGRGLLYFLEPGIYRTNVLPAHWADPSMSINNEAPSLVYGVDPIGVPTSGGANLGLPVTSAQYDLSSVPVQTVPTPDSSVFIPVPTGHTLFLGAFYSATGSGGVFATPINSNGTLGGTVKLTEKDNSDADVVVDQFSGDIRGVRLWLGRSAAVASVVTIAAMSGRLLETSQAVSYGPWVEVRRNLLNPTSRTGTVATLTPGVSYAGDTWTRVTPNDTTTLRGARFSVPLASLTNGETYRWVVEVANDSGTPVTAWMNWSDVSSATQTFVISAGERRVIGINAARPVYDATFRFGDLRIQTTTQQSLLYRTPTVEKTVAPTSPFDGYSTPSEVDTERYRWLGTAGASESVYETRTRTGSPSKQALLVSGPWIGGQGHSGCRFVGTPSYVNNGPVEGGRVGFAASFVEVGSWVYG